MSSPDEHPEPEDLGTYLQFDPRAKGSVAVPSTEMGHPFQYEPRARHTEATGAETQASDLRSPFAGETPLSAPGGSSSLDSLGAGFQPLPVVIEPGQVLFKRYRTIRLLGKGGMGEVWLVEPVRLKDERALKFIRTGHAVSPEARKRFEQEAWLMARIKHPNSVIVHAYDIEESTAFIEMEYLRGKSLDQLLTAGKPPPLAWTHGVMEQLCRVLEYVHHSPKIKAVHRDLKPANLMLLDDTSETPGLLKLLDLGIAKSLNPREASTTAAATIETRSGSMMGTAHYISPEQINEEGIDHRADIYALGVILYEFLTGYTPFEGSSAWAIAVKRLCDDPPKLATRNPSVHVARGLEQLVMRCLQRDRKDRPQTVREIIEEFRRHIPTEQRTGLLSAPRLDYPSLWPARLGGSGDIPFGTEELEAWRSGESLVEGRKRWKWRRRVATVMTVVAALGAGGGYVAWKSSYGTGRNPPGGAAEPAIVVPVEDRLAKPPAAKEPLPGWLVDRGFKAASQVLVGAWPERIVRQVGEHAIGFRLVPGREFELGHVREEPRDDDSPLAEALSPRQVRVASFYMQEFEVTNDEIEVFARSKPFLELAKARGLNPVELLKEWAPLSPRFNSDGTDLPSESIFPVSGVRHELALAYAEWLGGRLPTEIQWEYAARSGGKNILVPWQREGEPLRLDAPGGRTGEKKRVVLDAEDGKFSFGAQRAEENLDRTEQKIFDLLGNLREWCLDPYSGGNAPNEFVIRGGSFMTQKGRVSVYSPRSVLNAEPETISQMKRAKTSRDVGFRVVIPLE